jgi:pilus assembly protein CpaE
MPIIDARFYKSLLVSPTRAITAELLPLLAQGLPLAPVHDVGVYPTRRQMMDLVKSFEPKIVFLDATAPAKAFETLGELHSLAPQVAVVALLGANDPDMVLQWLRQGATDFLIRPFTSDQLDACVEKIARLLPAPSRGVGAGKAIAVMPAKGSAGATTIACNLAYQCKRLGATKIMLADMDPLTGTVSFLLKLKSTYSFMDVLQRQDGLEADLWKQMTMTTSQGVDVLLAPEGMVDIHNELPTAAPIVEFSQSMYEAVVLDCGGVYGAWNLSLARLADEVLLVCTNEVASLHAAQRGLIYLDSQRLPMSKVRLVVNRYQKDHGLRSDNFKNALDSEVFQILPADDDTVQKSLMDGKPIQNNTTIGKNLASMADRLLKVKDKDGKKSTAKTGGGLLSSLFR